MPGGNIFYFAPPGRGKSLRLAMQARAGLKYGRRKQFSNSPILDEEGRSTFIWSRDMVTHGIRDSDIFWDEIQMDYDSAETKTLPPEDDDFFATSGQCGNTVYCASQGLTRVTKAVRDRMNYFVQVEVVLEIPGLRNARGGWFRPILFRETWWENWEDVGKKDRVFLTKLFWFDKKSAMSYDTTWFSGKRREPPKPVTWVQAFEARSGDHERFTEHIDKIRQAGLWQAAKRFVISQRRKISLRDFNLPALRGKLAACKAGISSVVATATQSLQTRIFPHGNKGGQWSRFSYLLNWFARAIRHGDQEPLDKIKRGYSIGCPVDPEITSVLPGDDTSTEVSSLQQFQGVALAWSQRSLEKDMSGADPLVQGFIGGCEDELESGNRSKEVAGGDPESEESSTCLSCPEYGRIASMDCIQCAKRRD